MIEIKMNTPPKENARRWIGIANISRRNKPLASH